MLFLTLPVLVWQIDAAVAGAGTRRHATRQAFMAGWDFGFGYFVAGLFWVGEAFLVEAEIFAWLLPFAVTMLPAGLALFWGGAAAVAARFWRPGLARIVIFALALAIAEWLRGHVLTGFPWNLLGYALTWPAALMQSAALVGVYGLTLIAALILPAPLVLMADAARGPPRHGRPWLLVALPLAAMLAFGLLRDSGPSPASAGGPMIRIVQPSVPQREKWRPENQRRIFDDHLALSRRDAAGRIDNLEGVALVVWPEAAMPFVPLATPVALEAIGALLPAGTYLASGALRVEEADPGKAGSRRHVYNSLLVLGDGGRPVAIYDKTHLVPFGEYLPLQGQLEAIGLEQLARLRGGFATGVVPRPLLAVPGLPLLGAAGLLRGDLSGDRRAWPHQAGRAAQHHQRRLVRQHHGAAPAPASGPRQGRRGGLAADQGRQQRHLRDDRRQRPRPRPPRPQRARIDRRGVAGAAAADPLRPLRRLDIPGHAACGRCLAAGARGRPAGNRSVTACRA